MPNSIASRKKARISLLVLALVVLGALSAYKGVTAISQSNKAAEQEWVASGLEGAARVQALQRLDEVLSSYLAGMSEAGGAVFIEEKRLHLGYDTGRHKFLSERGYWLVNPLFQTLTLDEARDRALRVAVARHPELFVDIHLRLCSYNGGKMVNYCGIDVMYEPWPQHLRVRQQ